MSGSDWGPWSITVCAGLFCAGFLAGADAFPHRTDYVVHAFVHDDAGAISVAGRTVNVNDGGPIEVCERLKWMYGVPSCQCDVHPFKGD